MDDAVNSSRSSRLTIGQLSSATGVNIETIRYYERIGLMPAPPRSRGRQRQYDAIHRQRLTFIRRARMLGFSLSDIRELLGLARGHALSCSEVKTLTQQHISEIRRKMHDLRRLDKILGELSDRCRGASIPDCPIIEALSKID